MSFGLITIQSKNHLVYKCHLVQYHLVSMSFGLISSDGLGASGGDVQCSYKSDRPGEGVDGGDDLGAVT